MKKIFPPIIRIFGKSLFTPGLINRLILFPIELYDDFIAMNRKSDAQERLNGLRRLVHMLPGPHYETLKFLVAHLRKVADCSDVNKVRF